MLDRIHAHSSIITTVPVLKLKIAISASSLRLPLKKALHTIAHLGAGGVVLDARREVRAEEFSRTAIRQFLKLLEDLNLKVAALDFPTQRGYSTTEDLDRRVEATKQTMSLARQLRASVVLNQVGRVPEDEESPAWRSLVEVLTDLGRHGQRCGALLAATTGSESGAELNRLLDALPEGAIGVDFDPGNLIAGGHSVADALAVLGPRIMHVTAHDGVHDLAAGRGIEVQLGRGTADFPAIMATLEQYNYRGWVTIDRRSPDAPVAEAGDAVSFLKSIFD